MRAFLLAVSLGGVLVGCGDTRPVGDDLASPTVTDGADAANHLDSAGGVDGPVMYTPGPPAEGGEDALIEGALTRDGDCLFIGPSEPGQRFAALWPFGTAWDASTNEVVLRDGVRIPLGAIVSAGGGYGSPEGLSHLLAGSAELTARAAACAEGESPELAHVQHSISASAPSTAVPASPAEGAADLRPLHEQGPGLALGVDGAELTRLPLVFESWNDEEQWPNEPEPTAGIIVAQGSELSLVGEHPAEAALTFFVLGDDLRFVKDATIAWNGVEATIPAPSVGTWFVDVRAEYGPSGSYQGSGVLRAGAWLHVVPGAAPCQTPTVSPRWGSGALVTGVVDIDGCPVAADEATLALDALTPWFHCESWPPILLWQADDGTTTEYWQHEVFGEADVEIVAVPDDAMPTGRFTAAGEVLVSASESDAIYVQITDTDAQRWSVPDNSAGCA